MIRNSIPSQKQFNNIFINEEKCLQFLEEADVFYKIYNCKKCGTEMNKMSNLKKFRCKNKSCNNSEISIRVGTIFYSSKLPCIEIMQMGYLWVSGVSSKSAIVISGKSSATITNYYYHFRNLVSMMIEDENCKIGGPGIVVKLDETKLGKRKYNRGHRVEGVWIIVGIEETADKKIFAVPVENRNSETIDNVIEKYVNDGSIIHTDCWKGYSDLELKFGFIHKTVNHSKGFKNELNGVDTNLVEGINNGLKISIKPRNRIKNGIEFHLKEYIWRRQNKNQLWNAFIKAIKEVHYDINQ